jgi:hypothetical protein
VSYSVSGGLCSCCHLQHLAVSVPVLSSSVSGGICSCFVIFSIWRYLSASCLCVRRYVYPRCSCSHRCTYGF